MSIVEYIIEGLSVTREPYKYKFLWQRESRFTIVVDGEPIEYSVRFGTQCKNKLLDMSFDKTSEGLNSNPQLTNNGKPFDVFNGVGYSIIKMLEYFERHYEDCPITILSYIPATEDKDIENNTNRRGNIYKHMIKRISTHLDNPIVDTRMNGKRVNVEFKYPLNKPRD